MGLWLHSSPRSIIDGFRRSNVLRRANEPLKRYVMPSSPMATGIQKKRQGPTAPSDPLQALQTTSSIDPLASPTRKGTEDGSVPAVGVGSGNTSLLSLLTQTIAETTTTTAEETSLVVSSTEVPQTASASDGTNDVSSPPGSGTAIQTNAVQTEAQPQTTSTTTVQVQTTIFETISVTIDVTTASTDPAATATASGQQGEQQPTPEVTVVFVTAQPTFTGPIGGYTTLDGSATGNVAFTTVAVETASDLDPEPTSTTTLGSTTTVVVVAQSPSSTDTATASATPSASATTPDSVAVIPVTPSPVQGQVTVTETVTTTVTAQ